MLSRTGAIASLVVGTYVLTTIWLVSATYAQSTSSTWPTFKHDPAHTGQSQVDTSANPGLQTWVFLFPPVNTGYFGTAAAPVLSADGTIYSTQGDNNLYALAGNGTLKWTYSAAGPMIASPAVATDGTIYTTSVGAYLNGYLYAVNPDGTLKWSFQTGFSCESSPVIGSDGTIYMYCDDGKLYAVNPDGTAKWQLAEGDTAVNEDSSPAIGADGTIYFGSADYNVYAANPDGSLKWIFPTPGDVVSSPAVGTDGTIYVGSEYTEGYPNSIAYLFAINPDGSLKWYYTTLNYWVLSSPAIGVDGSIYFGDGSSIVALQPDGTLKWQIYTHLALPAKSAAIGGDGTIYIGANDGNVYAINPDGSIKWKFIASDVALMGSAPAIGADGTIYIDVYPYAPNSRLYAIGKAGPTPTSTPTPTPVDGKLRVSPQTLHFGYVSLGSTKTKSIKITNLDRVTKKTAPPPILIEEESGVSSPFSIDQACIEQELDPKSKGTAAGSCEVSVTFAPTAAIKYSGGLVIEDNLEPSFNQTVKLMGVGKATK